MRRILCFVPEETLIEFVILSWPKEGPRYLVIETVFTFQIWCKMKKPWKRSLISHKYNIKITTISKVKTNDRLGKVLLFVQYMTNFSYIEKALRNQEEKVNSVGVKEIHIHFMSKEI